MRTFGMLVVAAMVAAGADGDRTLARAQAHLKRGREALGRADDAEGSERLHALERAAYYLARADQLAAKTGDMKLQGEARTAFVDTLVRTSAAYYERKSLPSAKAAAERALALDPGNARATALLAAIEKAEEEDLFDSVGGVVAIDRVKARRLAAGVPLRDRGVARRR